MRTEIQHLLFALFLATGCSDTENLVPLARGDGGREIDGGAADAKVDADEIVVTFDAGFAYCGNRRCQCSDGLNNDEGQDELVDGLDPECTGATDDSEANFGTGHEQGNRQCLDCFFDRRGGGRGANSDGCSRLAACSTNPSATAPGNSCGDCEVAPDSECVRNCQPLTPNGCDCFGCCNVYKGGRIFTIQLDARCSMETLQDPSRCTACIQTESCLNACEDCELCPGRSRVPASCASVQPVCAGLTPCRGVADCELGEYCLQGCCFPISL